MKKTLKLTESEMVSLIKRLTSEHYNSNDIYNSEKLYNRQYVIERLNNGPKELKKYIKSLPHLDCVDGMGKPNVCTKVPEAVYVLLSSRY
jgi:hypothetical protein